MNRFHGLQLSREGTTQISLTDEESGAYSSERNRLQPDQFSLSTSTLDVRMPNASLFGLWK